MRRWGQNGGCLSPRGRLAQKQGHFFRFSFLISGNLGKNLLPPSKGAVGGQAFHRVPEAGRCDMELSFSDVMLWT